MDAKPQPHAFDFHTTVFQFRPSADTRESSLQIEIPTANLAARPIPARNSNAFWTQVISIIRDASGEVVQKFSADAPYEIPSDRLAELRAVPLTYGRPLNLRPARYTVDTAVIDRQAGKASTDHTEFEISEAKSRLALSSALLIRRIESDLDAPDDVLTTNGKRLIPIVHAVLKPDTTPYAYFVIYPDQTNPTKPTVTIDFRLDGSFCRPRLWRTFRSLTLRAPYQ
jgi:hypothetical protein